MTTPTVSPTDTAPNNSVPITVISQYVKDLSVENPNAPSVFAWVNTTQPQITVNINITTTMLTPPEEAPAGTPPVYEVGLILKAESKVVTPTGDKTAFIVECNYAGLFGLSQGLPEDLVRALLMVEAPRILFPFGRQVIANATQHAGFVPLYINPIDFGALYQRQLQIETQAAQQQPGAA